LIVISYSDLDGSARPLSIAYLGCCFEVFSFLSLRRNIREVKQRKSRT